MGGDTISHNSTVAERTRSGLVKPQNRKYLGSKYRLIDFLTDTILSRVDRIGVFTDLFAGTGVVGCAFRAHASKIIANDFLYSNYVVNRVFLASTQDSVDPDRVADLLEELNRSAPVRGYAHANYSSTYFTEENAARIDGIREGIEILAAQERCTPQERNILLASLLFAVD